MVTCNFRYSQGFIYGNKLHDQKQKWWRTKNYKNRKNTVLMPSAANCNQSGDGQLNSPSVLPASCISQHLSLSLYEAKVTLLLQYVSGVNKQERCHRAAAVNLFNAEARNTNMWPISNMSKRSHWAQLDTRSKSKLTSILYELMKQFLLLHLYKSVSSHVEIHDWTSVVSSHTYALHIPEWF